VVVVKLAVPPANPFSVVPVTATGLPKFVPFTRNCTVPLGSVAALPVARLCEVTLAVRVTLAPKAGERVLAPEIVVVGAFVIVTDAVPLLLL
jgi:hypothetical protein